MNLRSRLAPLAFFGAVAAVILVLDANLASRVTSSLEEVRLALAEPLGGTPAEPAVESTVELPERENAAYRMTGVAADLCSALTGRGPGSWMLPRTRRAMRDSPFEVRVEGERCRRGSSSHALHFTRRPAEAAAGG